MLNLLFTNIILYTNALITRKDIDMLYSIAKLTLPMVWFICCCWVFILIDGNSILVGLPLVLSLYPYLIIPRSLVGIRLSINGCTFNNNTFCWSDRFNYCLCFLVIVGFFAMYYEYIVYTALSILFGSDPSILYFIIEIITISFLIYNCLINTFFFLEVLGLSTIYTRYHGIFMNIGYILHTFDYISIVFNYWLKFQRSISILMYVFTIGLIIYNFIKCNLTFLDIIQFILFILSAFKTINLLFKTGKRDNYYFFFFFPITSFIYYVF